MPPSRPAKATQEALGEALRASQTVTHQPVPIDTSTLGPVRCEPVPSAARLAQIERLARLLFVWDERNGGNTAFSIDSDSVRYWFARGPNDYGEDQDCYRLCRELRAQAAFLLDELPVPPPRG